MTPEQITQFGLVGLALLVMYQLIMLQRARSETDAKIETARIEREKQAEENRKEVSRELNETRVLLASAITSIEKHQTDNLLVTQGLVQEVIRTNRDSVDAIEGNTRRTEKIVVDGRKEIITNTERKLTEAVQDSKDNQNRIGDVLGSKVDRVQLTADEIYKKVTAQINFGQVLDRMVEDAHSLVVIADRFATADSILTQFREAFVERVTSLENNVIALDTAVKELKLAQPRPSLDTVVAALEKRKTEPIPELPPTATGPDVSAVTTIVSDATPVLKPSELGNGKTDGEVTQ